MCTTQKCRCNKKGIRCGPDCNCIGCKNVTDAVDEESGDETDEEFESESSDEEEIVSTEVLSEVQNMYSH